MLTLTTPLEAYRADLANNPGRSAFTSDDAKLLNVGVLLHRVTQLGTREADVRSTLLQSVHALARELAPGAEGLSPAVRAAVTAAEENGALNLSNVILHLVARADPSLSAVEGGRLLVQRARVARNAGEVEQARVLYDETLAVGRAEDCDELVARAYIGYALLARSRGNYPEASEHLGHAEASAHRSGSRVVMGMVSHELMVVAAIARRFDEAMVHAWAYFRSVEGKKDEESDALGNLGQILLESGRTRVALHTFSAALSRNPPRRSAIPTLGGAVRAAAIEGKEGMVRLLVAHIDRETAGAGLRPESVETLGEAAIALRAFDPQEAERRRGAALAEALRSGFHELVFRLESVEPELPRVQVPAQESKEAAHVVKEASRLRIAAEYAVS